MILERERRGRVEILRLNRPEARNAINPEMSVAIEAALDEIESDGDVWCGGAHRQRLRVLRRRRPEGHRDRVAASTS